MGVFCSGVISSSASCILLPRRSASPSSHTELSRHWPVCHYLTCHTADRATCLPAAARHSRQVLCVGRVWSFLFCGVHGAQAQNRCKTGFFSWKHARLRGFLTHRRVFSSWLGCASPGSLHRATYPVGPASAVQVTLVTASDTELQFPGTARWEVASRRGPCSFQSAYFIQEDVSDI